MAFFNASHLSAPCMFVYGWVEGYASEGKVCSRGNGEK